MPGGVATIGRKFKALFRRRHDGQGSPARVDPQDRLGDNTEGTHVPPAQRRGAQVLPPRSLTPSTSREPYPRSIDTREDLPYLETPVTGLHRRSRRADGRVEAPFSEASPPVLTPPSHVAASHKATSDEQGEPDRLGPSPPNPYLYNSDHRRAATPSPQPSIAPSIGPFPSSSRQGQDLPSSTPTTNITTGGSSYFAGAQGVSIHHQQINHTNLTASKTVFEHLDPHVAHDAAHDSKERCNAPACHEETRVAIRQNIMGWINHGEEGNEPKRIMWLSGPAGGGKTAIAGSVAQQCKAEGSLAATFMFSSFSGSADRMSKRCFVATLAYHISQHDSLRLFEAHLRAVLERRRDIFHKGLKDQAEQLIIAPLRLVHPHGWTGWPKVIIVDGLDEVVASQSHDPTGRQPARTSEEDQVEILNVLLILSQSTSFPFRIFISSRPERNITNFFAATEAQRLTDKLFLDSKYNPDTDIKLFLESKFAEIRRHRGISELWPGEDALNRLVDMSSGQFIVPTTIIRWVENGLPQQQLDEVLLLHLETPMSSNPFATLDALYHHILLRTRNPSDDPRLVVKWIVLMNPASDSKYYISSGSPTIAWSFYLEDREGEFNYRMEPMSSLISIPPPHDSKSHVSFYHKSLLDFLSTKSRCGDDLYVDDTDMYPFIARRLLQTFKKKQVNLPIPLPDSSLKNLALLVVNSNYRLSKYEEQEGIMKGFLLYKAPTPGSKAALSAWDVTWWAHLIFNIISDMVFKARAIGVIYCTIHAAMECNHNTPSSPEPSAINQTWDPQCHEMCVQWQRDILAKAKELGWCVHRLEEIEVGELENVKWDQVRDLLKNVGSTPGGSSRGCNVCLIPAVDEVSDSGSIDSSWDSDM